MPKCEENTLAGFLLRELFPLESLRVMGGNCPFCSKPVNRDDLRDDLSKREFDISGICQACQDDFFKEK